MVPGQGVSNVSRGFVRAANGTITTFDSPGSIDTTPRCINNAGTITGHYLDGKKVEHGFVRAANGTIITFDPPGSIRTMPTGINNAGTITGFYQDASATQVLHGFLRASSGGITAFDVPDSPGPHRPTGVRGTTPRSINNTGTIIGDYSPEYGVSHGFVRASGGTITTFDPSDSVRTNPMSINNTGAIAGYYSGPINVLRGRLSLENLVAWMPSRFGNSEPVEGPSENVTQLKHGFQPCRLCGM